MSEQPIGTIRELISDLRKLPGDTLLIESVPGGYSLPHGALVHPAHDLLLRAKRGGAFNDLMGLSIPPLATGGAILLGLVEWNPLSFGRGKKITISRLANTLSETIDSDYSDYIDLDQAAALVNRSKRTLERKVDEMPKPAIRGTGGKKHEWLYPELRPWLQQEFNKILPERPPHARRR